ncbi:Granulin [Nibea albiflora]|uniref:Granulin n=1 Tax=Nibea albiflora TaxID=240163 RepID=A0ACB7EW70_NIBAL|nr:Granulin [Nibea albiflora]
MQRWVVICWALLALVGADECPDGGRCEEGQTCCNDPDNGYECCPFDQAECCEDHTHCCPAETICDLATSSCVNATVSVPWADRTSAGKPMLSKSFRMIRSYKGEDEENVCPDNSRCPPEYSCLKALTKYGCCPLPQGISCSDGKHCCPESHQCSEDSRSCIKKESVTSVLCGDGVSECPDGTTCCEDAEGKWGCCPMPKVQTAHTRCDVPCNDTAACPDNTTCCKTEEGEWSCCPLPEATCCEDHIHCCPHGKKCNLAAQTCDDEKCSVPWFTKIPVMLRESVKVEDVPCDSTASCPDGTTCCKNKAGLWACCPLPEKTPHPPRKPTQCHPAVCCDDHEHCCPSGSTCDPTSTSCNGVSGSVPMQRKIPAFTTEATTMEATSTQTTKAASTEHTEDEDEVMTDDEEENKEVEGTIQCDHHTSCPHSSTCCFMSSSQKWGCCPLPKAVCCADGNHCCPTDYTCNEAATSCTKGEVVIPWYTKLPATTSVLHTEPGSVQCDSQTQCPDHTTCCKLEMGEWGCCPLENAVCCPDKEHCCPQGYTCNIASNSCQKVIMLQVESLPLTPVLLPEHHPEPSVSEVKCDDLISCEDGQTCCRMAASAWGCCQYPNAVCCRDMKHCCPAGYTCTETGECKQDMKHWWTWRMFNGNKKRALIV